MLSLAAGQSIYGQSSSGNVVYTITGIVASGTTETYKVLASGFFGGTTLLFTPTGGTRVTSISMHNPASITDDLVVTVYIGGTGTSNVVYKANLLQEYTLTYDEDGWRVHNSAGEEVIDTGCVNIIVSQIAPTNPSLGDLWVQLP